MTDRTLPAKGVAWVLTDSPINELQAADIDRVIARCKQAHWVNIQLEVRINGGFETLQADWIKHLKRVTDPVDQSQLMAFYDVKSKDELIDRLYRHIDRLQAKLPPSGSMRPERVREG